MNAYSSIKFVDEVIIGPVLSVASLTLVYGLIFKTLCYVGEQKIQNRHLFNSEPISLPKHKSNHWKWTIFCILFILIIGGAASYYILQDDEKSDELKIFYEPYFVHLGDLTLTISSGRQLKTNIQLLVSETEAMEYLNIRLPEVQDIVMIELAQLSIEDVSHSMLLDQLEKKIIYHISQLFPKNPEWDDPKPLKKVLFNREFYIIKFEKKE